MNVLDCASLTMIDNHSNDRWTVWHGSPVPAIVCGFHGTYASSSDWQTIYASSANKDGRI